jgi:hypothetical protein
MGVQTSRIAAAFPERRGIRVVEAALVSTAIAEAAILPLAAATGEMARWAVELRSAAPRAVVLGVALALPAAKALVRTTKYAFIAHASAFAFEFIQVRGLVWRDEGFGGVGWGQASGGGGGKRVCPAW